MPIDDLPGKMVVLQRDECRDKYLRDYRLRNPGADTKEGTQPYIDASVHADALVPLFADATTIGNFVSSRNKAGAELEREAARFGTSRLPAIGGTGFVQVTASVGGGTILAGDELRNPDTGLRFRCTATALYLDKAYVPIAGIDTGPATNLDPQTLLRWTSPRPGIAPECKVVLQPEGSGLSGGRDLETDDELDARLVVLRSFPAAAGNNAEFADATTKTPGIAIQAGFIYPAINSSGSTVVAFTLRPATPGADRAPNSAQIADVNAWLVGQFPADDSIVVVPLVAVPVTVALQVDWGVSAASWADIAPWPLYTSPMVTVAASPAPTATAFRLTTSASPGNPQPGQTIAFYDQPRGVFRRKRIAGVTGSGPWDIVVETANAASDTSYTPVAGQPCCPWSDSLDAIVAPIVNYFDLLGPGEQVDPIPDPALRQRRFPRSPQYWPSAITHRLIAAMFPLPAIQDVAVLSPSLPFATPVGGAGAYSNILTLGSLIAFP